MLAACYNTIFRTYTSSLVAKYMKVKLLLQTCLCDLVKSMLLPEMGHVIFTSRRFTFPPSSTLHGPSRLPLVGNRSVAAARWPPAGCSRVSNPCESSGRWGFKGDLLQLSHEKEMFQGNHSDTMFLKRRSESEVSTMVFLLYCSLQPMVGRSLQQLNWGPQDGMAPQKPGCPGNHNGTTGVEMSKTSPLVFRNWCHHVCVSVCVCVKVSEYKQTRSWT